MSGYLFVGGTRDGQRIMVDKPQVELPSELPFEYSFQRQMARPCKTEVYRAIRIQTGDGEEDIVVYALAGMRPSDVLNLLIQRYK